MFIMDVISLELATAKADTAPSLLDKLLHFEDARHSSRYLWFKEAGVAVSAFEVAQSRPVAECKVASDHAAFFT